MDTAEQDADTTFGDTLSTDDNRKVTFVVRTAAEKDLEDINNIYNHAVQTTTASLDYLPHTMEMRREWFQKFSAKSPLFVAVDKKSDAVIGYAYYTQYRPRAGYYQTVETSVYVHADHNRRGIGGRLYQQLFQTATKEKIHVVLAFMSEENYGSFAFHKRLGFEEVGVMKEAGFKFDRYVSVRICQKILT